MISFLERPKIYKSFYTLTPMAKHVLKRRKNPIYNVSKTSVETDHWYALRQHKENVVRTLEVLSRDLWSHFRSCGCT